MPQIFFSIFGRLPIKPQRGHKPCPGPRKQARTEKNARDFISRETERDAQVCERRFEVAQPMIVWNWSVTLAIFVPTGVPD